ncbi:alpha/beta fold hydrolase [Nonomuraea candida]|uniref:alpha/beta fold hydrolase n=1 Tax=Nonomuraea candida TaxID=359159 RepID=UPI000A47A5A4|nr:alpha/beta fold hydrolase [Nonomuraea candida]
MNGKITGRIAGGFTARVTGLAAGLALTALAGTTAAPAAASTPAPASAPAAGTSSGPGVAAPASAPAAGTSLGPGVAAPVTWRPCTGEGVPEDMECGSIEVPVNWARPRGKQVRLDLARLPATEPARRIGGVLGVPGGPGSDGIEDLKRAAGGLTELRRRFDLLAYRPRTSVWAASSPASCARPGATLYEPRHRRQLEALAATMRKAFERCRDDDRTGLFSHLDSLSVARDMDAVRRALGEERLSFMANSYGGVAAAAYIRLFPQRIRAMYVDGVANQIEGWPTFNLLTYGNAQETLTRFGRWCARTPECALHGEDAAEVWRELTRAADREPIPVTSEQFGPGELTGWHLRSFGFGPDPGPGHVRWLAFAEAVDKARRGDGSGFAEPVLGNMRVWAMPAILAMTCGDQRGYTGWAELRDYRRQMREIAPDFPSVSADALGCTGWPEPVANPPRPLDVRGVPPVLGVGTTEGDLPVTEHFTKMVPGSVVVGYEGPGHVMYLQGKKCPIAHATAYLTDLRLPPPGTTCPAE